jgi:predicted metal-dependent HD superfamily phosphohydrolase
MLSDLDRWVRQLFNLGATTSSPELFAELKQLYGEPARTYHNLAHVLDCLQQFDQVAHLCQRPAEVELAIWFHDAIYDPQRGDNEERSAGWALQTLIMAGVDPTVCQRVYDLVLATKHLTVPAEPDAQLLADIDLSIFGRQPAEFDRYETAIRQEYRWMEEPLFRSRRAAILQRFLDREQIYQTEHFFRAYEAQARLNLARSLANLHRDDLE